MFRHSSSPDCSFSGRAAGVRCPGSLGADGAGVGARQRHHGVRSCEVASRAVGVAGGRLGRGVSCVHESCLWSSTRAPPTACPPGGRPGPAAVVLWPRRVRVWVPVTDPITRALASSLCALWGLQEVVGVAGASCLHESFPWLGTRPPPTAYPRGRRSGLAALCFRARVVRVWGPVTDPTACALASWRCAPWGWQEGV